MFTKCLSCLIIALFLAVTACSPQIAAKPVSPSDPIDTSDQTNPVTGTEAQGWSEGLPPNGIWQADLTADDFVRMGVIRSAAHSDWTVPYTLMFKGGTFVMDWQVEQAEIGRCEANYQTVGNVLRLTYINSNCGGGVDDIRWKIDDEGLHLQLVATRGKFTDVRAFYEAKPWQKFE